MKRRIGLAAALLSLIVTPHAALAGDAVIVKFANLGPDGSFFNQTLKEMGTSWTSGTQGRVTMRLFAGGVAGDEIDVVRKMRIGQLGGATLSVIGLAKIDEAYGVFSIPMFYGSHEELRHVLAKLEPTFRQRLEDRGFIFLAWGYGGEIRFFTKNPVSTVDQMKNVKMFASAGDDKWVTWWKANGFRPVALATTDILTGLETDMINGYPTTPLAALSLQWFRKTPYMLEIGVAPLIGATILTKKEWDRLSASDRAVVAAAAKKTEERFLTEVPKQDADAVAEMRKRGLVVTPVTGDAAAEWRRAAESFAASMRGSMVSTDIFDLARSFRDDYRKSAGASR